LNAPGSKRRAWPLESETKNPNEDVPEDVGNPAMMPVDDDNVSPAGKEPEFTVQV